MAMDGGPAFPQAIASDWAKGMSLRDWFAGQALTGMMATPHFWDFVKDATGKRPGFVEPRHGAALTAYQYADAMLAAREVRS
ncbi:hypothetical protein [Bosea sp. FBZP-16]|uniref:hypothetical protein n=1 Tax=Bosea sp. FBZP-16 TaxID=2065382 RepID=UPI000C30130A|nr:hypothetical protein [Bosea sp. FBZP-16]